MLMGLVSCSCPVGKRAQAQEKCAAQLFRRGGLKAHVGTAGQSVFGAGAVERVWMCG